MNAAAPKRGAPAAGL